MKSGDHCENCGQPTNGWFFIMIQKADGTWIERVNGSDPEPGNLYCCYDCSEQLEPPMTFVKDDIDDDHAMSRDQEAEEVSVYILLKDGRAAYVGIGITDRLSAHRRKEWDFDDMIENSHGPYDRSTALRLETILIQKLYPTYNVRHNPKQHAILRAIRAKMARKYPRLYPPPWVVMNSEELALG